jgi:cell division protein FtsZ
MEGAHGVLLSISGGSDLGLFEINEAASLVSDAAHSDANIIFGAVIDDALGDEVRVTVIAAGFDGGRPSSRKDAGVAHVPAGTSSVGMAAGAFTSGLPHRSPAVPATPAPPTPATAGERLVGAAPSASMTPPPVPPSTPAGARPALPNNGSPLTVPPLPPISGSGGSRRPLSSEDFEEELDIPEFLRN